MLKLLKSKYLVVVAATLAAMLFTGCNNYDFDDVAENGYYQQRATESFARSESAKNEHFTILINAEITADKTGRANVLIGNATENNQNCYVTLYGDNMDTPLYRSPELAPGERVAYAQLDTEQLKNTKQEEISATAIFTIIDAENGKVKGSVEAGVSTRKEE